MEIMIVDDESIARDGIKSILEDIYPDAGIHCFSTSDEAVEAAKKTMFSIACLDVMMEPYNGIETAKRLMSLNPRINIIFTTGFDSFTMEAMNLHASGYLLKPITRKKLEKELQFLRYEIEEKKKGSHLRALCLGNFDFLIDGVSAVFAYSKSKELLAYLIDRKGTVCTNNEISAILGDDDDNVLGYSYLNGIRRDLVKVFEDAGYPDLIIRQRGGLKIDTEMISCDYYDLLEGKQEAINAYNGEYMSQYSWAEPTNGELWRKYGGM